MNNKYNLNTINLFIAKTGSSRRSNTTRLGLIANLSSSLLKLIESDYIIFNLSNLKFREYKISDTNAIKKGRIISIKTGKLEIPDNIVGKYNVEKEGDWFYLEKIEENL